MSVNKNFGSFIIRSPTIDKSFSFDSNHSFHDNTIFNMFELNVLNYHLDISKKSFILNDKVLFNKIIDYVSAFDNITIIKTVKICQDLLLDNFDIIINHEKKMIVSYFINFVLRHLPNLINEINCKKILQSILFYKTESVLLNDHDILYDLKFIYFNIITKKIRISVNTYNFISSIFYKNVGNKKYKIYKNMKKSIVIDNITVFDIYSTLKSLLIFFQNKL
jgi:hypothetical protein